MIIKTPIDTKTIEILPPDAGTAEIADYNLSKQVGDILMEVYPGYAWLVRVNSDGGVCMIKCGQIECALAGGIMPSMVIHMQNMTDPSILRKKIIRFGGELLERANLKRGKWSGELPKRVDGIAEQHQPRIIKNA